MPKVVPKKENVTSRKNRGIKSRTRVKDQGEVFTEKREVDNILALTEATSNRYWRFLEPTCGNGNFLEAILRQRLDHLKQDKFEWHPQKREFSVLKIISTIYGVDIAADNIAECKGRLRKVIAEYFPKKSSKEFRRAADIIFDANIIVGDMLNGKEKVFFVEWTTPVKNCFRRRVFALTDMENGDAKPLAEYKTTNFKDIEPLNLEKFLPKIDTPTNEQLNLLGGFY